MIVYNKSIEKWEKAKKEKCPRCGGFGAVVTDRGENCELCRGTGKLWVSQFGTGWTRPLYGRKDDSRLY